MYLNDFEKNELENYFANKFVKQDFYKNYDEDFLSAWENLIINYNAEEILNEHICKARPVQFISPDDILAISFITSLSFNNFIFVFVLSSTTFLLIK